MVPYRDTLDRIFRIIETQVALIEQRAEAGPLSQEDLNAIKAFSAVLIADRREKRLAQKGLKDLGQLTDEELAKICADFGMDPALIRRPAVPA